MIFLGQLQDIRKMAIKHIKYRRAKYSCEIDIKLLWIIGESRAKTY